MCCKYKPIKLLHKTFNFNYHINHCKWSLINQYCFNSHYLLPYEIEPAPELPIVFFSFYSFLNHVVMIMPPAWDPFTPLETPTLRQPHAEPSDNDTHIEMDMNTPYTHVNTEDMDTDILWVILCRFIYSTFSFISSSRLQHYKLWENIWEGGGDWVTTVYSYQQRKFNIWSCRLDI